MDIQSVEVRLREIDSEIFKIGAEYSEARVKGMGLKALDERARFLRVLFRRRDVLLEMYASEGCDVLGLYTKDVRIGGNPDGANGFTAPDGGDAGL